MVISGIQESKNNDPKKREQDDLKAVNIFLDAVGAIEIQIADIETQK